MKTIIFSSFLALANILTPLCHSAEQQCRKRYICEDNCTTKYQNALDDARIVVVGMDNGAFLRLMHKFDTIYGKCKMRCTMEYPCSPADEQAADEEL